MSNLLPVMDGGDHPQRFQFNPILIGLLGIVSGAIMVAAYHCIAAGFQYQRRSTNSHPPNYRHDPSPENNTNSTRNTVSTLIPVCRYGKELNNEAVCSVCLSEFNDGEQIRVLPECAHFFHVACIDMWLSSHSNCPLCRANTVPPQHVVLSVPDSGGIPPTQEL